MKKQEEFEQFYKIEHYNLDKDWDERIEVEGEKNIEDRRYKFRKMNIICEHCNALK